MAFTYVLEFDAGLPDLAGALTASVVDASTNAPLGVQPAGTISAVGTDPNGKLYAYYSTAMPDSLRYSGGAVLIYLGSTLVQAGVIDPEPDAFALLRGGEFLDPANPRVFTTYKAGDLYGAPTGPTFTVHVSATAQPVDGMGRT